MYSQDATQYGNEGDTVILKCPLTPPAVSGRTTWRGPPSATLFFMNTQKNPDALRKERLYVIQNTSSGAYNLQIANITYDIDEGMYSCDVNAQPYQQHFVRLKFNGKYWHLIVLTLALYDKVY